ncbi:Thioesterase/thiol ester dehydrase-isomerase [Choiromyces venosus 120613-1]|uniref:Thioesterase/thiol ester dehydrase-isomerase n=1 Tax=Choiromyces venosus 120613-1 TaxID=1336337 RepID=A0A3N4JFC3_9PEZI|nr:Thioesterase/thiol ester dehydrase-isomerase [Choiromyces venosus 120613-1]
MVILNRSPALVGRMFRSSTPLISPLRYLPTTPTSALRFASAKAFEPIEKSAYQKFSDKVKEATFIRPSIWLLSGVTITILTTYSYIMAAQGYIALTDEESLQAYTPTDPQEIEANNYISSHPLATSLRSNPAFSEARPTLKIADKYKHLSFTAGTLAGPGKIVVPPLTFVEDGGKSMVQIFHLGEQLCGHPGYIHGGMLATILDEGLARCCFAALPNKIAMTASLTVNYRKPSPAGSYVVLKAKTVKVEGRKAWVEGRIETLVGEGEEPSVLVEANALMIEPKQAATLKKIIPDRKLEVRA